MSKNWGELLRIADFIKEAQKDYGINTNQRALQFYSSPKLRLLPIPTHKGGHIAYYPREYLKRLKIIKILQKSFGFNLEQIKKILNAIPRRYLDGIYDGSIIMNPYQGMFLTKRI